MPTSNWNGKYPGGRQRRLQRQHQLPADDDALVRGYAISSTDTGHAGGSASFGLGHPEKVIDFGWRAVHEMAVASKKIIAELLRQRSEVLLLERLLGRRTSGDEGSAALPCRFRRHHRRRAGPRLDRPRGPGRAHRERLEQNEAARLVTGAAATASRGGARSRVTRSTA